MTNDDFENQLSRKPMREIPAEWRVQILGIAGRTAPATLVKERHEPRRSWLRDLLWPCPQAWAAFACIWAGIIFSELVEMPSSSHTPQVTSTIVTPESMRMWIAERRTITGDNGAFGL